MVVDDTHVRVIRLSGLLLLFIMLSKYGDNGSKCEFRNARSAFSKSCLSDLHAYCGDVEVAGWMIVVIDVRDILSRMAMRLKMRGRAG